MIHHTNKKHKKTYLLVVLAVVLLIAGCTVFAYASKSWPFTSLQSESSKLSDESNIGEASDTGSASVDSTDTTSEDNQEDQKNDAVTSPTSPRISVVTVDAGQYERTVEVRAYISGVIESGGTCTFTFTQGSSSLTRRVTAVPSANSTACTTLSINTPEFPSLGTWMLVINYTSSASSVSSQPQTLEIK